MPGRKPASATPSRKRSTKKLVGLVTNIIATEMMPQVTMIRPIQKRAPTFARIRLLGTSNSA